MQIEVTQAEAEEIRSRRQAREEAADKALRIEAIMSKRGMLTADEQALLSDAVKEALAERR